MFSNLVNKAKDAAESATESVVSIKDAGGNKVSEMVVAFKDSLPHLKGAGYELTEFEIELGISPKLIPHFKYSARSESDIARELKALKGNTLGIIILTGLTKAGAIQKNIAVAGCSFTHIEIELGVIPTVKLKYQAMVNHYQHLNLISEPA